MLLDIDDLGDAAIENGEPQLDGSVGDIPPGLIPPGDNLSMPEGPIDKLRKDPLRLPLDDVDDP